MKDQLLVIHLLKKEKFSLDTIADLAAVTLDFVEETQKAYFLALEMLKEGLFDSEIATKTGLLLDVIEKIK